MKSREGGLKKEVNRLGKYIGERVDCLKDNVDELLAMRRYNHSKKSINSSSESSSSESSSYEETITIVERSEEHDSDYAPCKAPISQKKKIHKVNPGKVMRIKKKPGNKKAKPRRNPTQANETRVEITPLNLPIYRSDWICMEHGWGFKTTCNYANKRERSSRSCAILAINRPSDGSRDNNLEKIILTLSNELQRMRTEAEWKNDTASQAGSNRFSSTSHVSMGHYSEYTEEYETYWVEFTALFNNRRKKESRSPTQMYNILSIEIGLSASTLASFYRHQKSPRTTSMDKIIEWDPRTPSS
ncbi:16026_t:CDS:2 [Cetraspora pellucida]|uniref:16026_t:CDS:1 n=1 Tax=Cetraspora pellucida TaxID=1433469 RepID=A0A9N9AYX8_9GLOM|nr:16026_t:CDS:2 [Cetraspora pellucida]